MELTGVLSTLNGIAAIVVVLGLCLYFHEAGHFLAAKAFGCKVHDFAFGFGPSLIARKRGETTYRVNIIPFGGYVRIAGMEPGSEAVEGGFHSIPRYQSAIILCAGVTMNVVLAIIMFTIVALWSGVPDPSDDSIIVGKVMPDSPAQRAGLMTGDKIVAIEQCRLSLTLQAVSPSGAAARAGLRPGMVISKFGDTPVHLPIALYRHLLGSSDQQVEIAALDYQAPSLAEQQKIVRLPRPDLPPEADCKRSMRILEKAWGVSFSDLDTNTIVGTIGLRPERPVSVTVLRDGAETGVTVVPTPAWARQAVRDRSGAISTPHTQTGRIGVVLEAARKPVNFIELQRRDKFPYVDVAFPALEVGVLGSYGAVRMVGVSLWLIATKQVQGATGGPVAIMAMSAEQARVGWDAVLRWVGIISANLAVINIIPAPPFDGFRVTLLGLEAIIRRRIDAEKDLALTLAGVIVIVIFLLILTSRDILNLIRYGTP